MVSQPSFVRTGFLARMRSYPAGPIGGTKAWPPSISMLLKAASVSSIGTSTSCPRPVRSRRSSAAATAPASARPQSLSPTRLGTKAGSSSVPTAEAKPEAACAISSKAGRAAWEHPSSGSPFWVQPGSGVTC